MNQWNVGVYIRLSQEDGDKEESNSITNQRELINNYIQEDIELKFYDYYIDDGWSGTNFNRPDFKRLINDIETGVINTIIVKDLSRFGRNYIEVGNYLEQIFPLKKVRFIAINDNIDSYKNPESINSIIVPFKNLMNDEYARDISQKVKYALNTRKRNGEYMGSIAPYGYLKDPNDKHKLIVDEIAAVVVKKIFALALKGIGTTTIARTLNKEKINTPSMHKRDVLKIKCNFKNRDKDNYWDDSMISRILRNRIYLGEMVQCKTRNVSYKLKKRIKNTEEDMIIVKGTHKALVSYEKFEKVGQILDSRVWKCNFDGTISIFSGKIFCGDCNKIMMKNKSGYVTKDGKKSVYYYCSTYYKKSHESCTNHSINYNRLIDLVLKAIQEQIKLVLNQEKVIKTIWRNNEKNNQKLELKEKVDELKEELLKINVLKKEIYMDWKKNIISQEDYFAFVESYSKQINDINNKINEYENKINDISDKKIEDYIEKYKQFNNITSLDKEVIDELIEKIYVFEDKKIEIKFKYNDINKNILEIIRKEQSND